LLKISNLTKVFPNNITAVDGVSFELDRGDIACLIGTSGCGKTTTLKMINRLVEPSSGRIDIEGMDFDSSDVIDWRRHIGYVIQNSGLLPHLTVYENISLLSKIKKRDLKYVKSRVFELLDVMNLDPKYYAKKYPSELSGGQQQRVGIARALMENPPLLLMDEPFGALDPITRSELHDEFLRINKTLNKTIIMVTHDIKEAKKLATKIAIMEKGKVIQFGSPQELTDNPVSDFVREFMKGSDHD
jgi:osmoprotectant transport system ATP-binding protein